MKKNKTGHSASYLAAAAKMSKYEVNIDECFISIPEDEINTYVNDLPTLHLVNIGFKIQLCMPGSFTKQLAPFDPEIKLKDRPVKNNEQKFLYNIGDTFRDEIGVSMRITEIQTHATKGKSRAKLPDVLYTITYLNASKVPLVISETTITKQLQFTWTKVK